jgi:hypothetical protein
MHRPTCGARELTTHVPFCVCAAAVLACGDLVAVASFGRFEVIEAFLQRICPGVFSRANISTPSCVGFTDGCAVPDGKTPQLDALLGALLPAARDRVLFFDDSKPNVIVRLRARALQASRDARCADAAAAVVSARSRRRLRSQLPHPERRVHA